VNRRGVWKKVGGGQELFIYYSSGKQWGDEEDLEGGGTSYWLAVASTALALTPQITRHKAHPQFTSLLSLVLLVPCFLRSSEKPCLCLYNLCI
jgi:hypothetical protein